MKPGPLLFAASLALNAVLLAFALTSRGGSASLFSSSSRPAPSSSSHGFSNTNTAAATDAIASSPDQLAAALKSGDHATLRAQLRALGLPDTTVNGIIRSILWRPYYEKQRELALSKNPTDRPYWRGLPQTGSKTYTREERAEIRALASSIREQARAVLGEAAFTDDGVRNHRYAFLTPESADKLADLDRDYGEMRQEISQESDRFKVPSDAEKIKFLEQERRKDLEATLSPAELAEYDLRYSPAAMALRSRLKDVEISEAEYRDLYDLQKVYQDSISSTGPSTLLPGQRLDQKLSSEQIAQLQARAKTYEQLSAEIHNTLGDERYEQYRRASNSDYRQLQAAGDRFNIPTATLDQVYNLRGSVSADTQRIYADPSLTPEQKKQSLASLANQTRTQITTSLGDEVAAAYLEKNMQWLRRVQSGSAVTFPETGNRVIYQSVAPAPRPQKGAAPDRRVLRTDVEKR
jgi:hypothetical protein